MRFLIISAHPYEKSFNHQIIKECTDEIKASGMQVDVIDLYQDGFNPVLSKEELAVYNEGKVLDNQVSDYQQKIINADYLLIVTPIWWVSLPAILKGFFDRVFLKHFAFEIPKKFPKGVLSHIKGAVVISTMSAPGLYYQLKMKNGIKQTLIKGTLQFSGIKKVKWLRIGSVDNLNKERADKIFHRAKKILHKLK